MFRATRLFLPVFALLLSLACIDATHARPPMPAQPVVTVLTATGFAAIDGTQASLVIKSSVHGQWAEITGFTAAPESRLETDVYRLILRTSEFKGGNGYVVARAFSVGESVTMTLPRGVHIPTKNDSIKFDIQIGTMKDGQFYEDVTRPASVTFFTVD